MSNYRLTNDSSPDALDSDDETLRAGNHKSSGSHSNEWLVNIADDVVVPMVTTEVVEALRAGRLSNRSLVWRIGMHDWSPLAEVPALRLAAGPSALPSAASTPGPIVVKKPAKPSAEQRRRNTLPMGFPAVRDIASVQQPAGLSAPPPSPPPPSPALSTPRSSPSKREDSSDALAVYERAAPSLTFADSVRAEWQGTARIVNQAAPRATHSPAPRRLTPVPPVAARLPARVVRSAPSNTLSPTTAEAEIAAPARGAGAWGDRSVVLASELRAVKKTSKRIAVWAAAASALVASAFTFWASRASVPSFRPAQMSAPAAAVAPEPIAAKLEAAPATAPAVAASSASPVMAPPATAATVALSAPKPVAVVQAVRVAKRAKPAKPAAEPTAASTDNPYADDAASESKPSEAKASEAKASDAPASDAKPASAATLAAAIATAVQGSATPAPVAAPAPASPGPASAATPGF